MATVVRGVRLGAAAALFAVVAGSPVARGGAVPYPVLVTTDARQEGSLVWVTSHAPAGPRICSTYHADGAGRYPDAVGHEAGAGLGLRLARPDRPTEVTARLWRAGVAQVTPGPAETVAFTLAPVRSGRRVVAWDVLMDPPGPGELHIDVTVEWPRDTCGVDGGRWRYHVRSLYGPPEAEVPAGG